MTEQFSLVKYDTLPRYHGISDIIPKLLCIRHYQTMIVSWGYSDVVNQAKRMIPNRDDSQRKRHLSQGMNPQAASDLLDDFAMKRRVVTTHNHVQR